MLDRRTVLTMFAKAMMTGAGWLGSDLTAITLLQAIPQTNLAALTPAADTFDEQLQTAMTGLANRVYSEQGIPMILACEDLVTLGPISPSAKAMNEEVAPAFHRDVEAWERLHPGAPAEDVARLVELLAYKDFADGGRSAGL